MAYDYQKERQEAIAAGNEALNNLRQAQDYLDSARNWGIYDIMGGGFFSSLIKQSRMSKAQQYIYDAKLSLNRFENELRDLDDLENIDLNTNDFWGFADAIFDGIFADIAIQKRINNARSELSQIIMRVENILRNL